MLVRTCALLFFKVFSFSSVWMFVCTYCMYVCLFSPPPQVSEVEVNGQIEAVCESVFSEMESQAVDALDLPMPGCFRMRSHSYVRAIEKGCSQEEEEGSVTTGSRRTNSPPRTTTTVRTIQSSTGGWERVLKACILMC